MPIERGSATKKTTTDDGTSLLIPLSFSFTDAILDPLASTLEARGAYNTVPGARGSSLRRCVPHLDYFTRDFAFWASHGDFITDFA